MSLTPIAIRQPPPNPIGRAIFVIAVLAIANRAVAQDVSASEHDHAHTASVGTWAWTTDDNVFFGYNYQQRKFRNFSASESQNWFMLTGTGPIGAGQITIDAMISLEPITIAGKV